MKVVVNSNKINTTKVFIVNKTYVSVSLYAAADVIRRNINNNERICSSLIDLLDLQSEILL